jgi:hypothetical protein
MSERSQRSFAAGEITPALYERTDLEKYATALRTMRNFLTMKHGGASRRRGTEFIAPANNVYASGVSKNVRLIPFVFSPDDAYAIELSNDRMRFYKDGSLVTDSAKQATITGATAADPVVVTATGHSFLDGETVYISGVVGMTELNGGYYTVANKAVNTFELTDMAGTDIDGTSFTAYDSGGTGDWVVEVTTNYDYDEADLFEIDFTQSLDVMTITHKDHPAYDLARTATGPDVFTLTAIAFDPGIDGPANINISGGTPGTAEIQSYAVTAIAKDTYEESYPGAVAGVSALASPFITAASTPAVTIASGFHLTTGQYVTFSDVLPNDTGDIGNAVNGKYFRITRISDTEFNILDVDLSGLDAVTSGNVSFLGESNDSYVDASSTNPITVTWSQVLGAAYYNIYKIVGGDFAFVGIAAGTDYIDEGFTVDGSLGLPIIKNDFLSLPNEYPAKVAYFQQRRFFGNTITDSDRVWGSKVNAFKNYTNSIKLNASDGMDFRLAGNQLQSIKHIIDAGKLVVFTTSGEWVVEGGSGGIISPVDINLRQKSYDGASSLKPLVLDGNVLYVQERGNSVKSFEFDFNIDGYKTNILSILSSHLTDGFELTDWAYQKLPDSILWTVRDDGKMLGLTYIQEQSMLSWHRHDMDDGEVVSVTSIPESINGLKHISLYAAVKRFIDREEGSKTEQIFIERMDTGENEPSATEFPVEHYRYMDSYVNYNGLDSSAAPANLTLAINTQTCTTAATGPPARLTITNHGFTSGDLVSFNAVTADASWSLALASPRYIEWIDLDNFDLYQDEARTIPITGGSSFTTADVFIDDWSEGSVLKLTCSGTFGASLPANTEYHLISRSGTKVKLSLKSYVNSGELRVQPNRTVPMSLRTRTGADALTPDRWATAKNKITGLDHLEGEAVSVVGFGSIVASPINPDYDAVTVSNGSVTLNDYYTHITVGVPYVSDIETLSIDSVQNGSIKDRQKLSNKLNVGLVSSGSFFSSAKPPSNDTKRKFVITGATAADPCVVTMADGHNFENGERIFINNIVGMTELNGSFYEAANATDTTIELFGIDSSAYTAYASGGSALSRGVPLENMYETKIVEFQDFDSDVAQYKTDVVDVVVKGEWNNNGRIFIRCVDPVPLTITSIDISGQLPKGVHNG